MSTYRDLLLSTGGGVIGERQMDEQAACATIAIGLGGTGVDCLRNLKRQVYARLQPDDPDADIPVYSHIKFLAVDTDKNSLAADGKIHSIDETTEFFDISTAAISALIADTEALATHPEFKWLKTAKRETGEPGLKILSADAGAGGVRQIGRLLLIQKSAAFVAKIEQLIREAKMGLPGGSDVNIHIFTGMGGGTGSGTFLDVCYLVQQALRNSGEWGHALTLGYFFLPDVNLSKPTISANPAISEYIKANGFAAMKELDYCMNFENNGANWNQQYMGFAIQNVVEPPVKICHLVSAATTSGAALEQGYDYAMNVVSDFIMQFVVKNSITMNTHIANYFRAMGNVDKTHGANYTYCLLGASNAVVPMREITTYLSSKLFEEMAKIGGELPTNGDIAAIAQDNGLTYQQLQKSVLEKTSCQLPLIQLDHSLFKTMSEEDQGMQGQFILPETIVRPYEKMQEDMVNKIEVNVQALTKPWAWEEISGDTTSVSKVCRVYHALSALVSDPACGPAYAATALNGSARKNLVALLRGVLDQTKEEHGNYVKNMDLRCEEVKQARRKFLHPGFMESRKKLFGEFMARVQRYYSDDSRIKMLEKMETMLLKMIPQFEQLAEDCFDVYARVTRNLTETFHENYQTLTNRSSSEAVADPFIIPLMTVEDMKESLDKTVTSMKLDQEMSEFHSFLFRNNGVWNSGDEKKIAKSVSTYLVHKFDGYTQKTLTDYLEIRFNTANAGELTNKVYEEILKPLDDKATPLFWKEPTYQIENASPLGYCCVPDEAAAISAAAKKMELVSPELQQIVSKLADRIFLLRCTCGVPMYAYNGIGSYFENYKKDKNTGKQIYEHTGRDPRDWRKLPNLIPFSKISNKTEEQKKQEIKYENALEQGIIRQNPEAEQEYQLIVTPSADEAIAAAEGALEKGDEKEITELIKRLDITYANMKPERIINIPNDGMLGHEETVRKDHVLASAEDMKIIAEELEKKEKLRSLRQELESSAARLQSQKKEQANNEARYREIRQQYFDALMTGVITFQGRAKVLYQQEDEFGLKNEIILSIPSSKPYGGFAPLYQGFHTFFELPDADREAAVRVSNARKDEAAPEIQTAIVNLKEMFKPEYVQMMQSSCGQQMPEKEEELKIFIRDFLTGLKTFSMLYGE